MVDVKIGNSIFPNGETPQKLVLAPNAIIKGNTVVLLQQTICFNYSRMSNNSFKMT